MSSKNNQEFISSSGDQEIQVVEWSINATDITEQPVSSQPVAIKSVACESIEPPFQEQEAGKLAKTAEQEGTGATEMISASTSQDLQTSCSRGVANSTPQVPPAPQDDRISGFECRKRPRHESSSVESASSSRSEKPITGKKRRLATSLIQPDNVSFPFDEINGKRYQAIADFSKSVHPDVAEDMHGHGVDYPKSLSFTLRSDLYLYLEPQTLPPPYLAYARDGTTVGLRSEYSAAALPELYRLFEIHQNEIYQLPFYIGPGTPSDADNGAAWFRYRKLEDGSYGFKRPGSKFWWANEREVEQLKGQFEVHPDILFGKTYEVIADSSKPVHPDVAGEVHGHGEEYPALLSFTLRSDLYLYLEPGTLLPTYLSYARGGVAIGLRSDYSAAALPDIRQLLKIHHNEVYRLPFYLGPGMPSGEDSGAAWFRYRKLEDGSYGFRWPGSDLWWANASEVEQLKRSVQVHPNILLVRLQPDSTVTNSESLSAPSSPHHPIPGPSYDREPSVESESDASGQSPAQNACVTSLSELSKESESDDDFYAFHTQRTPGPPPPGRSDDDIVKPFMKYGVENLFKEWVKTSQVEQPPPSQYEENEKLLALFRPT